jgi:hypothetical protein
MITSATNPKWEEFFSRPGGQEPEHWKFKKISWEGRIYVVAWRTPSYYVLIDDMEAPDSLIERLGLNPENHNVLKWPEYNIRRVSWRSQDGIKLVTALEELSYIPFETRELTEEEQAEIVI